MITFGFCFFFPFLFSEARSRERFSRRRRKKKRGARRRLGLKNMAREIDDLCLQRVQRQQAMKRVALNSMNRANFSEI